MAKHVSSNVNFPIKGWFLEPFRMLWIQDTAKYISSTVNVAICKVKFRLMMVNCQLSRQRRCQKLFTGPNPYLVLLPFRNRLARLLYTRAMHCQISPYQTFLYLPYLLTSLPFTSSLENRKNHGFVKMNIYFL